MNIPPSRTALPLEYASEIVLELHLLRGECCDVARTLLRVKPRDTLAVEHCAVLDEALDRAHRVLKAALEEIRRDQARLPGAD